MFASPVNAPTAIKRSSGPTTTPIPRPRLSPEKCRCLIKVHGPKNCPKEHSQHGPHNTNQESPQNAMSQGQDRPCQDPPAHGSQDCSKRQQDHRRQKSAQDRPANGCKHPKKQSAKAILSDDAKKGAEPCPRNAADQGHDDGSDLDHVGGPWHCPYGRSQRGTVDAAEKGGNCEGLGPPTPCLGRCPELVQVVVEFLVTFHLPYFRRRSPILARGDVLVIPLASRASASL